MRGRKTGCRICGVACESRYLCAGCRTAILKLLLRTAAVVCVLALVCGGYLMILRRTSTRSQDQPMATGHPASAEHSVGSASGAQTESNPPSSPVSSASQQLKQPELFSPDMFAPQITDIAGRFVTAIAQDKSGNMWFGSEEYGVVRWTKDGQLTLFTSKHGLGDDNGYALVADADNNIWVGTLNHGLSKYDGKAWTTYSLLDGLGGVHVYCLALGPDGKTIWCGHENGISRFDGKVWKWFSLSDGLPWREITAIAVSKDGTVWAGGAMGGLGYYDGKAWKRIAGENLPDDRINGLCLAGDGRLWVATCKGIGCYNAADQAFGKVSPPETFFGTDSHVTSVAEDRKGCVWFGSRRGGLVKHDPKANEWMRFTAEDRNLLDDYVNCVFIGPDCHLWLGVYGYGVSTSAPEPIQIVQENKLPASASQRPEAPIIPTAESYRACMDSVNNAVPLREGAAAVYIGEDWETQGDWIGSYGCWHWTMAAMGYPLDYNGGIGDGIQYKVLTGDNRNAGDGLAGWVHWRHSVIKRSLQNPIANDRRQADWDDRGEKYPLNHNGPNLYINIALREKGVFRISLYFVNKDEHELKWRSVEGKEGANRFRDYTLQVKEWDKTALDTGTDVWGTARKGAFGWVPSEEQFDAQPLLAQCRVHNFYGGVYKSFLMSGASIYRIRVSRGASHNTICSGIFVDKMQNDELAKDTEEADPEATNEEWLEAFCSKVLSARMRWLSIVQGPGTLGVTAAIYNRIQQQQGPDRLRLYRKLLTLLSGGGYSKTLEFLIGEYCEELRRYVHDATDRTVALSEFRAAAEHVWKLEYTPEEQAFQKYGQTRVRDARQMWQEYFKAVEEEIPEEALSELRSVASGYKPKGLPGALFIRAMAQDFLMNRNEEQEFDLVLARAKDLRARGEYERAAGEFMKAAAKSDKTQILTCYDFAGMCALASGDMKIMDDVIARARTVPEMEGRMEQLDYHACMLRILKGGRDVAMQAISDFEEAYPNSGHLGSLRDMADPKKAMNQSTKGGPDEE